MSVHVCLAEFIERWVRWWRSSHLASFSDGCDTPTDRRRLSMEHVHLRLVRDYEVKYGTASRAS